MALPTSAKLYQIGSVQFANRDPGDQFDQWFAPQAVFNTEAILDGGGAFYTDVGSTVDYEQREYRAEFDDDSARNAVVMMQGTVQTFKRLGSRMPMSRSVLVVTAVPMQTGVGSHTVRLVVRPV